MRKIEIYVDGSCKGNPGKGGYGIYIEENGKILNMYADYDDNTTNNRMELSAIIRAFDMLARDYPDYSKCIIYSDSAYCINMANDWIFKWKKNRWKRGKNGRIENLDLVKKLYNCITDKKFTNVSIVKVVGHAKIFGNEVADALAQKDQKKLKKLLNVC